MSSNLKIIIPKPCHENWSAMSPKEKGRFCGSCSKTVVDFTKKSPSEIKEYLIEKKHERVCGHFYKKQLDSIVIEIPQIIFHQQLSFQKIFVLALFFVMGTTLFSCQYTDGQKQKIENVILKNSTIVLEEDLGLITPILQTIDSTIIETSWCSSIDSIPKNIVKGKTPEIEIVGDIITTEGEIVLEETVGFIIIENSPRFKEAENLSKGKAKKDFDERMNNFVQDNFDISWTNNLGLSEKKYKIFTQFTIDEKGVVIDIKVRAPHPKIKKEVLKMIKNLPQFIPGEQSGKAIKTKYSLPITFIID
jgi:hypothetical protein